MLLKLKGSLGFLGDKMMKMKNKRKKKAAESIAPETETKLEVSELDRLRYGQAQAIRSFLEERYERLSAVYELHLRDLDTDGSLRKLSEEIRQVLETAKTQAAKVEAISDEIGKKLGVDLTKYNMNAETGELTEK